MKDEDKKWVLTDDDTFQLRKNVSDDVFELYEIVQISCSDEKEFKAAHAFIYVSEIDIPAVLECYGYGSLEELQEVYGDEWKGILAECDFELTAGNGECIVQSLAMTWDDARRLICNMSGYKDLSAGQNIFNRMEELMYTVCWTKEGMQRWERCKGVSETVALVIKEKLAGDEALIFPPIADEYKQSVAEIMNETARQNAGDLCENKILQFILDGKISFECTGSEFGHDCILLKSSLLQEEQHVCYIPKMTWENIEIFLLKCIREMIATGELHWKKYD